MCLFMWLHNKKIDVTLMTFWSLFISILIQSFCSTIHLFILKSWDCPEPLKILLFSSLGAVLSFVIFFISKSRVLHIVLSRTTHKTTNSDVWDDLIDYGETVTLRLYLKSSDILYIGKLCTRDEKGCESWIALIDYGVLNKNTFQHLYDSESSNEHSIAMINLKDVERVEIKYNSSSKTWSKYRPY